MKQRWMITCALLHDPAVLFLVDPSRRRDTITAGDVRASIEQLSINGKIILLTIHLLEEADQVWKRVPFIVKRRIVANDTPEKLKPTMRIDLRRSN
jgi:ABC-type multidrug transport system ATPase subunit